MYEQVRFISSLLPSEQQREFEVNVSPAEQVAMSHCMQVQRWMDPKYDLIRPPGFRETNEEHTGEMIEITNALDNRFTHLPAEVNFDDTRYIEITHDLGEGVKGIGDVPATGPIRESPKGQQRKRLEPILFNRYILPQIDNDRVRERVANYYRRYHEREDHPEDKEAWLAKLMDLIQGNRTAHAHILNYRERGIDLTPEHTQELKHHVQAMTHKTLYTATVLMAALSSAAQTELQVFMLEEIERMRRGDFAKEVDKVALAHHTMNNVIQSVVGKQIIIFDPAALQQTAPVY